MKNNMNVIHFCLPATILNLKNTSMSIIPYRKGLPPHPTPPLPRVVMYKAAQRSVRHSCIAYCSTTALGSGLNWPNKSIVWT